MPARKRSPSGVCAALNNKGSFDQVDLVYSTHRPTGHAIAKGVDMKKMAAEYDFRATGLNGGYGGEMHIVRQVLRLHRRRRHDRPRPRDRDRLGLRLPRPRQQAGGR